jgi:Na+-translocating ferredoxin:NAD+ oxidoreductase RnfG subunit
MVSSEEARRQRLEEIIAIAHKNNWTAKWGHETPGLPDKIDRLIKDKWRTLTSETIEDYRRTILTILRSEAE